MILLVSAQHLVAEQQVRIGVSIDGVVEVWTLQIGQFGGDDGERFQTLSGGADFDRRFLFDASTCVAITRLAFALLEGRPYQLPRLVEQRWQGIGTRACLLPDGHAGPLAAAPGGSC